MVGVPCLFLCHAGPTSLIVCPNFSLCSTGISHFPSSADSRNAASAVAATTVIPIASISNLPSCVN